MPAPKAVEQAFVQVEPVVREVERYVRSTLRPYCESRQYHFFDRKKNLDSLAEKLETGRVANWSDLGDLYGCTIVIPTAADQDAVIKKLDASFVHRELHSRANSPKPPNVFRFDGTRWRGVIDPSAAAVRQPGAGDLVFEVQVVTAFEYAWMVVDHDLVYKADSSDWRRLRLTAQLKAAVEQVEILIASFESASSGVALSPWPESEVKGVILTRVRALVQERLIPTELQPDSWRRFADNVYALVASYQPDPDQLGESVDALLTALEDDLRGAEPRELPHTGTLFQYVLSTVARRDTEGSLSNFRVVPSSELRDLYGLVDLPLEFSFE